MDHPVAGGEQARTALVRFQPAQQEVQRLVMLGFDRARSRQGGLGDRTPGGILRVKPGLRPDALDLPGKLRELAKLGIKAEERELDAR